MGTDIHLEVERLGEDGVWHWIEHPERDCDDDYCTNGLYNEKTPNKEMHGKEHYRCQGTGRYTDQFWNDRNYDVFAILAGVRNGYGFAGVDTGDGFEPIAEPRGLPADLGPEITASLAKEETLADADDYDSAWRDNPQRIDLGEHSFSWLAVKEILDYDWARTTVKRGWVDPWNFELWRRNGKPTSWSGGIEGAAIEHISNAAMARMLDSGGIEWIEDEPSENSWDRRRYTTPLQRSMAEWGLPKGSTGATIAAPQVSHYTQVEWPVPYADQAESFLRVLQRDIVPLGTPDTVRLVFGFDS